MKVVYIAHPLRGDWEANMARARAWCGLAVTLGYAPVAPYLALEGVLHDDAPHERNIGLALDLAIIARCEELWACGTRVSTGMAYEIDHAQQLGIEVRWFETFEAARLACGESLSFETIARTIELPEIVNLPPLADSRP